MQHRSRFSPVVYKKKNFKFSVNLSQQNNESSSRKNSNHRIIPTSITSNAPFLSVLQRIFHHLICKIQFRTPIIKLPKPQQRNMWIITSSSMLCKLSLFKHVKERCAWTSTSRVNLVVMTGHPIISQLAQKRNNQLQEKLNKHGK